MSASKEWMFCPLTGSLLTLDATSGVAKCPISGWQRKLEDLDGSVTVSKSNIQDYRRRFNLEPLVKEKKKEDEFLEQQGRTRATVDDDCPKCGNHGMEYYTRQLRSADEGQTIFYECPNCG
ncbi:hypothetical protein COCSUDRAFT_83584 [Coccomyxa subellipsoidea C-169]|uniref:DNA-directed RNA polymerase subunit n=1 Tax=Coccomyxa subellipsoidea (strain C-169) TaxID=574566 RepID=I0Z8Q6_COCSC|nr:hypothetical protein COCSUDRAFT_83584 [Coccomyxa subellipsoidea C-169]EIE27025.1 hypothetical protein COCSUDRAFT_83584 [Coccomyxa subellipsoidea C-169]|eukprot:XP_005651569.1 hypothetical protein COCSUDRAFT_83584 [Coccomyxa subellipsoidea C-169]